MYITVIFDCYAKIIECDNLKLLEFNDLLKKFKEWLYEEKDGCLYVKASLNVEILDILVVLRFLNENYHDFNARISDNHVAIENIDLTLPIINL